MDKFQTLSTILGTILGAVAITSVIAGTIIRSHNVEEIKKEVRELRDKVTQLASINIELVYVKETLRSLCDEFKEWRKEKHEGT